MLTTIKVELCSDQSNLNASVITDLPSSIEITSLYHLTSKLFKIVPLKFFQNYENLSKINHYIAFDNKSKTKVIHLSKLVSAYINTLSSTINNKIKSKKIICASSAIVSKQNEFYADGIIFPGSQEFLCKLCDNIDQSIVVLRSDQSKQALPTSFPVEEITYDEESIQCIQEVVNDYQGLYPEFDFCLVFPNSPIFIEVAKISKRISPKTQIFLKVDNEIANLHSNEVFGSYIYATCLAYDRRLLDERSILTIVKKAIEELQGLIYRKQAYNPSVRWNDLRTDIHAATLRMTTQITNEALRNWILHELGELKKICKQNQAALWLSEEGADMILAFREFVLAQETGKNISTNTNTNAGNFLIDSCKGNTQQFNQLRQILVKDISSSNLTNAKPPVPSRSRSTVKRPPPPPRSFHGGTINNPPINLSRTDPSRSTSVHPPGTSPRKLPPTGILANRGKPALSRSQPVPRGMARPTRGAF